MVPALPAPGYAAALASQPLLEGVTIEQLRTLRAVASAGSFSAAARKLGRVQAAVSQSIDRLEAQLGLRLFSAVTAHVRDVERGKFGPVPA